MKNRIAAASLALAVVPVGCGDVAVRVGTLPRDERPLVCRDLPKDVPSPVKLLVAIDTSGSMQFTDQGRSRFVALTEYVAANAATPNLFVQAIGFDESISTDPAGFVPPAQWQSPAFLERAGVQTDHQAVLERIHDILDADMRALSNEERARTRYVVTLLTDGSATPVCCNEADQVIAGGDPTADPDACPLESWEQEVPAGQLLCDDELEQSLCNDPEFYNRFREQSPGALESFSVGSDRNRAAQLRGAVDDILALGRALDAGDVDVNAALLFDPTLPEDIRAIYRLNECRLRRNVALLDAEQEPAVFLGADAIDFAVFEARPICEAASGACKAICTSSLEQLQDEFGVRGDFCDDDAFEDAADDCVACEAAFAAGGVDASVCPE